MKRSSRIQYIFCAFCVLAVQVCAGIPEGYYNKANGKRKAELKAALHEIIRMATVLGYGSGEGNTWSGFYLTDRTADNYCIDRYSKEQRQFGSTVSAISGMNIEHSFAKSWWGGDKVQAYYDLYNLMPSDATANSRKSNYAMGVVDKTVSYDNGSILIGKGSMVTNSVWEPEDKWKGDFARTYMYMVTCYSDLTWRSNGLDQLENNEWPTFNYWTMKMVLEWSRQDPVDEIELQRNEAVYNIQGNRNPFVDYPNLCEYVWGDSVDYAFDANGSLVIRPDSVVLIDEPMTNGHGCFYDVDKYGNGGSLWMSDSRFGALANAYSTGKVADNYLLAYIDLTDYSGATLEFVHQIGYTNGEDVKGRYFHVLVTDDFTDIPYETTWESLDAEFPVSPSSGWSEARNSGVISLDAYAGRQIVLAFRYISDETACYGWEIKDVKVKAKSMTSDIEDVISDRPKLMTGKAHDLTGRRVDSSRVKGIYILNGRKYIK